MHLIGQMSPRDKSDEGQGHPQGVMVRGIKKNTIVGKEEDYVLFIAVVWGPLFKKKSPQRILLITWKETCVGLTEIFAGKV